MKTGDSVYIPVQNTKHKGLVLGTVVKEYKANGHSYLTVEHGSYTHNINQNNCSSNLCNAISKTSDKLNKDIWVKHDGVLDFIKGSI